VGINFLSGSNRKADFKTVPNKEFSKKKYRRARLSGGTNRADLCATNAPVGKVSSGI
jgi:hypothetical protein